MKEKIVAVISENPLAQLNKEPEIVKTFDVTPCLTIFHELKEIADFVHTSPDNYCQAAHHMAYLINEIENYLN